MIDFDQVVYQRWQWGDSSFLCHLQAPLQVNNNIHYCLFDCWYHLHETWKRYQITKEQNKMILVFLQVHKLWFDKLNKTKICHKLLLLFGKLHSFRPLTSYLKYISKEEEEFVGHILDLWTPLLYALFLSRNSGWTKMTDWLFIRLVGARIETLV